MCLLLTCCTFEYPDAGCGWNPETDYSATVSIYYESCYGEPYYEPPLWCDWYDDGATCCTWMVDGWYEEWCQWDTNWCWEYNGAW